MCLLRRGWRCARYQEETKVGSWWWAELSSEAPAGPRCRSVASTRVCEPQESLQRELIAVFGGVFCHQFCCTTRVIEHERATKHGGTGTMSKKNRTAALAYLRTSSSVNVGADKDSDKRQRAAIEAFAKRAGYELVGEYYDQAV